VLSGLPRVLPRGPPGDTRCYWSGVPVLPGVNRGVTG